MALPINIEDLLEKRKVESNRIEFKEGWNPTSIYRLICAFANDVDNIGGGYILVGVKEENGVAQRPVKGLPVESLDKIQREMVQFNQLIEPQYSPRISVEEVDGKTVLVIWVTTGHNRPYTVPADMNAKLKKPVFYIRYGTSSIEAKGEFLDQLRDMANREGPVPMMIRETLNYLRVNIVKERIQKPVDDEHSVKVFNYPYQALEEAVVNALYHRDYMQREPVEITVEPDNISILSYSGPDRSISMEDINEAKALRSRRYRNRRLGDFLKELNLTEGRATGIPTIQKKLSENGSPKAVIKTDEARTFFLIIIPCRKDFVQVDAKVENVDIQNVVANMSKICPRYVQDGA